VPGCAIQSRERVQPGSYLEMRLLVPDSASPLRVGLAKVRWSEERRFGVEFIQMPGRDQVRLGQLVQNDPHFRNHLDLERGKGSVRENIHPDA
ncbi:MAG: PilZ domain-containing protein, partial [Nitrospiraceae bacterium]